MEDITLMNMDANVALEGLNRSVVEIITPTERMVNIGPEYARALEKRLAEDGFTMKGVIESKSIPTQFFSSNRHTRLVDESLFSREPQGTIKKYLVYQKVYDNQNTGV